MKRPSRSGNSKTGPNKTNLLKVYRKRDNMSKIETEREKLHRCIDEYGLGHPKTIEQSQKLDVLIAQEVAICNSKGLLSQ